VGETIETPQISFSPERLEFYISDTLSITLIDDNRQIETPAGTFSCYVYYYDLDIGEDLDRVDYYLFYSPRVGLIKQEERSKFEKRLIAELVLTGYQMHNNHN
jgi:hypothetical protein